MQFFRVFVWHMLGMPESNYSAVKGWLKCWLIAGFSLATARPPLPSVLSPRVANCLPLDVGNRVWSTTGERLYVILEVTGTRAACSSGGGQGCSRWNSRVTSRDRYSFAERGPGSASAIAITTMKYFGATLVMPRVLQPSIAPGDRDDRPGSRSVPRDAGSPFGRRRNRTLWQPHAICRQALGSARHRVWWPASQAPKRFGPQDDESRRRDDDPERGLRQIAARRHSRELAHDELQIGLAKSDRACSQNGTVPR
jgi:hypothetical protein